MKRIQRLFRRNMIDNSSRCATIKLHTVKVETHVVQFLRYRTVINERWRGSTMKRIENYSLPRSHNCIGFRGEGNVSPKVSMFTVTHTSYSMGIKSFLNECL